MIRLHGAVDQYRLPKELFYFYEAMWSDHPVLHILGHWNHKAGGPREVIVFSNCTEVDLTLNGELLGQCRSCSDDYPRLPNPPWVWEGVPFEAGTLTARGPVVITACGDTSKLRQESAEAGLYSEGKCQR